MTRTRMYDVRELSLVTMSSHFISFLTYTPRNLKIGGMTWHIQ